MISCHVVSHMLVLVLIVFRAQLTCKEKSKEETKSESYHTIDQYIIRWWLYYTSIHSFLSIHSLFYSTVALECPYNIICPFLCCVSIYPDYLSIYILYIHRTFPMRRVSYSKSQNQCILLNLLRFFHQLQRS